MKTNLLKTVVVNTKQFLGKNAPFIFATGAVVGVVGTAYVTVRCTLRAKEIVDEIKEQEEAGVVVPNVEKLKKLAPVIVPPTLAIGGTISLIVLSNRSSAKKLAALGTAYSVASESLKEWKEKTEAIAGSDVAKDIQHEVAKTRVADAPVLAADDKNTLRIGYGNTLCKDDISGRYFFSDPLYIKERIAVARDRLYNNNTLTLNEFYSILGLPTIAIGDEFMWDISLGHKIKPEFDSELTPNSEPVLLLDYEVYNCMACE